MVKLTSRPAIYRQKRVGLYGNHFFLYKFRSMYIDAEARSGPKWATKNDPRITPIGRWLRLLRLDELPQFFNVLRGEMAVADRDRSVRSFARCLRRRFPSLRSATQLSLESPAGHRLTTSTRKVLRGRGEVGIRLALRSASGACSRRLHHLPHVEGNDPAAWSPVGDRLKTLWPYVTRWLTNVITEDTRNAAHESRSTDLRVPVDHLVLSPDHGRIRGRSPKGLRGADSQRT